MTDPINDLRLLRFVCAEAAVGVGCWRFVTAFGRPGFFAIDAMLLSWVVRYAVVCGLGLAGVLSPGTMTAAAGLAAAGLIAASWRRRTRPRPDAWALAGLAFVSAYAAAVCWQQRYLPPLATDALAYHLPAAAQWLREGRLGLFPTWFFNPANTYSPLGGSVFYAWTIGLLGAEAPVQLTQAAVVPLVYLAAFAVARGGGAGRPAAALAAAALCVARPVVDQLDKGKDDLFLLAFFAVAVAGLTRGGLRGRLAPWRLGAAVGLFLAIKFTALLALPVLLLAADAPWRAGWRGRSIGIAGGVAILLAGPWYVRNILLTGNPLFPADLPGLPGLFTAGRSLSLRTPGDIAAVLFTGPFAVPRVWAAAVGVGWLAAAVRLGRRAAASPVRRLVVAGPVVGIGLFLVVSPYPETRFLLPALLPAAAAAALGPWGVRTAGLSLAAAAVSGVVGLPVTLATYLASGLLAAAAVAGIMRRGGRMGATWRGAVAAGGVLLAGLLYVNWTAYLSDRRAVRGEAWAVYPQAGVWAFVEANVPATTVIACAGSPLIYPLTGPAGMRPVVYAPVRPGVRTPADLPRLGGRLAGEEINPAAARATVAAAAESTWLANLAAADAGCFVAFAGPDTGPPVESTWADARPRQFTRVYADAAGVVYAVTSAKSSRAAVRPAR